MDELRAIIHDGGNTTACFTLSTQFGAGNNQVCLYGKRGSLIADSTNRMLIPVRPMAYKSYLRFFLAPRIYARHYRRNSWQNMKQFLKRDFHMDYGMKMLIQSFYQAVEGRAPVPISYREILATARIMDGIFEQMTRAPEACQVPVLSENV